MNKKKYNKKFETAILLADIHAPEHSKHAINLVLDFMKDFRPDRTIFMGDQLDMGVLSHWDKNKKKKLELKRLKKDYELFDKEILTPISKLTNSITWITGNHEDWVAQYIEKEPGVEGLIEPEICMDFAGRGIEYVPFNEIYSLGKLSLIHGYYWNNYHAAKHVNAFHGNVCYGHTHTTQEHTKVTPVDVTDYHSAVSLPCLSNTNPDFLKNRPNAWIHGFGVVYLFPNGDFNLYIIKIVNNKFIFNGKIYESKKKTRM